MCTRKHATIVLTSIQQTAPDNRTSCICQHCTSSKQPAPVLSTNTWATAQIVLLPAATDGSNSTQSLSLISITSGSLTRLAGAAAAAAGRPPLPLACLRACCCLPGVRTAAAAAASAAAAAMLTPLPSPVPPRCALAVVSPDPPAAAATTADGVLLLLRISAALKLPSRADSRASVPVFFLRFTGGLPRPRAGGAAAGAASLSDPLPEPPPCSLLLLLGAGLPLPALVLLTGREGRPATCLPRVPRAAGATAAARRRGGSCSAS
jgi:hypothetical protein